MHISYISNRKIASYIKFILNTFIFISKKIKPTIFFYNSNTSLSISQDFETICCKNLVCCTKECKDAMPTFITCTTAIHCYIIRHSFRLHDFIVHIYEQTTTIWTHNIMHQFIILLTTSKWYGPVKIIHLIYIIHYNQNTSISI